MARRTVIKGIPKTVSGVGATSTLTIGAQKALREMRRDYGATEGNRIWLAKAEEQGHGATTRQKVNSTYKMGAKLGKP
jgi:hypothetical protein